MIEALALLGSYVDGATVRRADGVAIIATGLPIVLFNQVIVEEGIATSTTVAAAVEVMRERGSRFVVNLRVGPDDRFVGLMGELGLAPMSERPWLPGMALHPMPTEPALADLPGHEIRHVTDKAGLEDHISTASMGFDLPEEILRPVMVADLFGHAGVAIYVGYTDGEPVSAGLGMRTGRTVGVFNIATHPSARGRGYGAAMTRRVAADGAAAGCDVATLQASEMRRPIYERLGYQTVVEYMAYIEPPPLD